MVAIDPLAIRMAERIRKATDPDRIVLFGSRARGEGGPHSDFDILIVAASNIPRWRRTAELYGLLAGMGAAKEILWWTSEEIAEWRDVKSHFINRVLREGTVLYEKRT